MSKLFPDDSISKEAVELTDLLSKLMRENKPDRVLNGNHVAKWEIEADRLLRVDGRNFERAKMVLNWCQRDEFWMCNILSMKKFRQQFDQLEMRLGQQSRNEHKCGWCGRPVRTHAANGGQC